MTIDERLEKLTERHEAIAESLELLTGCARAANRDFGSEGGHPRPTDDS
jgi:hypothetical protein